MQVAHQAGSAALLASVRGAFVQGLDTMLWVCGGIALVSAVLGLMFLPRGTETGVASVTVGETGGERAELGV